MDFLTAMWLGFAFSIGVSAGAVLVSLVLLKKPGKSNSEIADETNAALKERNCIGTRQVEALKNICTSLDEIKTDLYKLRIGNTEL